MFDFLIQVRKAFWQALSHDVLNTAKAAAYSGMLMLFPALLVITTLLAQAPEGALVVKEMRAACMHFLPADTMQLLQFSFQSRHLNSGRVLVSTATLTMLAALGIMLSLMEGFRRAYHLPKEDWGFWNLRLRAFLLVHIALVPLTATTLVLVFGHPFELWMIAKAGHQLHSAVIDFWRMVRWILAMGTAVAVLSSVYHFGTPRTEHWRRVLPGALSATMIWFPSTLFFGWYVSRIASYAMVYGSLGAGIATMVWLYLTSFSFLFGAEINGVLYRERINDSSDLYEDFED